MRRSVSILSSVALGAGIVFAQPVGSFDVASIHPAQPAGRGLAALREDISTASGSLTMRNVTMASAIRWAHDLKRVWLL